MRKSASGLVLFLATVFIGMAAGASPAHASTTWLCKPGLADNPCQSDLTTLGLRADNSTFPVSSTRNKKRPVDCFYVYPTVSGQEGPNADLTVDPEIRQVAVQQAARFSRVCRVFAPVYRQFTISTILTGEITDEIDNIAYSDVNAAFSEYMKKYNKGHGVILIGHSQGAGHLARLVSERVDRKPRLRKKLVSAILVGGNVFVPNGKKVGGQFKNVPTCSTAKQNACLVAFSSFPAEPPNPSLFGRIGGALSTPGIDPAKYEVACVNPAALDGSKGAVKGLYNTAPFPALYGPLLPDLTGYQTPWISINDMYRASCQRKDGAHWLQFDSVATPEDLRPRIDEPLGPSWGSHLTEVNDVSGNLVAVAGSEVKSYLKKRKAASKRR